MRKSESSFLGHTRWLRVSVQYCGRTTPTCLNQSQSTISGGVDVENSQVSNDAVYDARTGQGQRAIVQDFRVPLSTTTKMHEINTSPKA